MERCKSTSRLNLYLGTDIDSSEYVEARNFLFIWGLFESRFFPRKNSFQFANVLSNTSKFTNINTALLDRVFAFLTNRYMNNNGFFNALKLSKKQKSFVSQTLSEANCPPVDKVAATIFIIYRYRNNLFHGNKDILSIPSKKEIFEYANDFLLSCLELNTK